MAATVFNTGVVLDDTALQSYAGSITLMKENLILTLAFGKMRLQSSKKRQV